MRRNIMSPKAFRERGYLSLFASYYRPHLALFLLDMICALGIAAVDLSFPQASRWAMQTLLPDRLFTAFSPSWPSSSWPMCLRPG